MTAPVARLTCLVSATDDLDLLPGLARAGVDGLQVRAKDLSTRELAALVRAVLEAVASYDVVVSVNDRVDVALATGAAGVHLGADDLSIADARRLGPDLQIGATCRTRADVVAAASAGADYAGFGPVLATDSKPGLPDPLGVSAIREAAGVVPLIAIGGVTATTAAAARTAGAHGVAVIGAIWRHPHPVAAAEELVTAIA